MLKFYTSFVKVLDLIMSNIILLGHGNKSFCLPDNHTLTLQHLKSLVNQFQLGPVLIQNYILTLHHQLEKGIIERVDASVATSTRKYYLPHYPVLTLSNTTTKVHIVYDGSAKGL